MRVREYRQNLLETQKEFRSNLLLNFKEFNISSIQSILNLESNFLNTLENLKNETNGFQEEYFFSAYKYLLISIFHLLKFVQKELNGEINNNLNASKININLIELEQLNYVEEFKENLKDIKNKILKFEEIVEVKDIINDFTKMTIPFISEFPIQKKFVSEEDFSNNSIAVEEKRNILSFSLNIENEPWPNPKVLKPEVNYKISGKIKLNFWPSNFNKLIIKPFSTTDNNWFIFSIPVIYYTENVTEYEVEGNVIFKYPQNSIDDNIAIKLLAFFENDSEKKYPILIGYDQLILKVLDPNSFQFMTGFSMMNQAVFDISCTISKELSNIDKGEKHDFIQLLSGILNYQGFSIQQGRFKNINSLSESQFRDELIRHLIGLPSLGENIIKEGELSGGRVEILYKGIVAELKVEKKVSNREKMIEKYIKQPVAYSSGNIKRLSILCILDLTKKINPPASPINNIKFVSPKLHGFENEHIEFESRVAVIIIDGNTKKPSDYSK